MNDKIKDYLLNHPIDRTGEHPYKVAAKVLGVSEETIRSAWRSLRRKGLVETQTAKLFVQTGEALSAQPKAVFSSSVSYRGENATVNKVVDTEVRNEKDLARECEIDLNEWTIKEWECKRYNAWIKNKDGEIESQPKFSVYAKMVKRTVESDIVLQKEVLLRELKDSLKQARPKKFKQKSYSLNNKKLLLELALFDVHFGKLSHEEESGEDYDLKIAAERYRAAIDDLLSRVNLKDVGRILLPLGQDLFNIDNINKTTTNFTPQDNDTRFHKMVKIVKDLLIETIEYLATIAPVDIVIVVGNHDTTVTFLIGEVLDAYFNGDENITINNSAKLRKYYTFGRTSFMFTHGDREKQADLGMIFAAEESQRWADSTQRYIQIGHYHHTKKINYLSANEFQGFQIQILPSLSPNDAWHAGKGYSALRQAKGFLFDEEKGLVAEFTYTA